MSSILIIGDVHGERERLSAILDFAETNHITRLYCTGDLFHSYSGNPSVDETGIVELLQNMDVHTVQGNHDEWYLDRKSEGSIAGYIRSLPHTLDIELKTGTALFCHGIGKRTMAKVGEDDYGYAIEQNFELWDVINSGRYRYMINGHTHHRMTREIAGLRIINAGSLCHDDGGAVLIDQDEGIVYWISMTDFLSEPLSPEEWFRL